MKVKNILSILMLVASCSGIYGERQFRPEGYHFYKDISPASGEILHKDNPALYGVLPLNDEITEFGKSTDLRISLNRRTLPYFIRGKRGQESIKKAKTKLLFAQKTRNGRIYVLELPVLDGDYCYSSLEASSPDNFETGVYLQHSNNLKDDWNYLGQRSIFQYNAEKQDAISLDCLEARYLRLEMDSETDFTFPSADFSKKTGDLFNTHSIDLSSVQEKDNSDNRSTLFYIENKHRRRISRIVLNFEQSRYRRNFEIYRKNPSGKSWVFFMRGVLSGEDTRKNMNSIDFPDICDEAYRIEIFNEDNSPLTIKEFSEISPREEIIFQLPPEREWPDKDIMFRIYYGNSYAHRPDYDIHSTYDSGAKHLVFAAGPHTENSEFAYSIIEPPVSIWIIRALFAAGFILASIPGYFIFKKYSLEMNTERRLE